MGRPLDKLNFGDTATGGAQLQCTADIGSGNELCYIESQTGTRTYQVVAEADDARTGRVRLQQAVPAAEGEARMTATPNDGVVNLQATATSVITGDAVTSFVITEGGTGYAAVPNVVVSGDGTGATATATLTAGVVTGIAVDTGGTGFTVAPTVTIDPPALGGADEAVESLQAHRVKTFEGNSYRWELGVDATAIGAGGAHVQDA